MALLKHRPKLRLKTPRELRAGNSFQATVVIDAKREVPVDNVTISLIGKEQGRVGFGKNAVGQTVQIIKLTAELAGKTVLPAGRTELPCRFDLPVDTAPSYVGKLASTSYQISVRASIPWWPDAKEDFEIIILATYPTDRKETPTIFPSDTRGPQSKAGYFEASLPTLDLESGSILPISVALSNVAYNRYATLEFSLIGREHVHLERTLLTRGKQGHNVLCQQKSSWSLEEGDEGESFSFSVQIPPSLAPTFSSKLWSVHWTIGLKAVVRWGRDVNLQIPIRILPVNAESSTRQLFAPPDVGSERVNAIWQDVAAARQLTYEDGALSTRVSDHGSGGTPIALTIKREHRGSKGIFLVGKIDYPALHLGLEVAPAGLLGNVNSQDIDFFGYAPNEIKNDKPIAKHERIAAKNWNKAHALGGREEAQITAFFGPLAGALLPMNVARMTDDELVVEYRNSGTRRGDLNRFAQQVVALATAIPLGRANIPAPAEMQAHVPSWRSLAQKLDGVLELSRMAIRGSYQGLQVRLATHWLARNKVDCTRIELELTTAIGSDHTFDLQFSDSDTPTELPSLLPGAAASAIQRLREMKALSLRVEQSTIHLDLPGRYSNALDLLDYLDRLVSLADALRPMGGPYR